MLRNRKIYIYIFLDNCSSIRILHKKLDIYLGQGQFEKIPRSAPKIRSFSMLRKLPKTS